MPCYGPLTAYRPKSNSSDRRLVFRKTDSETGIPIKIPCGKCPGCKLEQSRQWAVRCMHEKRLHNSSCFVTLTYDDNNLPNGNTLVKSDLQNFLKRLAMKLAPVSASSAVVNTVLVPLDPTTICCCSIRTLLINELSNLGLNIISMTHLHCRSCGLLVHMPSAMSRSNRLRMSPLLHEKKAKR